MKTFLRDLILGKDKFIDDYSLFRRAMLLGSLELAFAFIATFYFILSLSAGSTTAYGWYSTIMVISVVSIILTRKGAYTLATILQMLMANGIVFYYTLWTTGNTTYLFFISNSLAALALFGFQHRRLAVASVLLSLVLFVVSYTGTFGLTTAHTSMSFFVNLVFVLFVSVLVLYFTLRIHHHAEKITKTKNAQLQKANAELDRFVYSASHDLRAPLSSMLGLIQLAQKTTDPAELDVYLGMMKGRIHHLDEFIREIIDYSRNERMEVKAVPVNLHQLVEETTLNLRFLEGADTIAIQNEIPPDLVLPSDAMRLKIVFNNLLNNAIKYHDPTKDTRFIKISSVHDDHGTSLLVRDNGMGISSEHVDKVFNMFYRASDKSKGSGLGLYIVRESLGQLGGSVTLKSQLGEGSTFTVLLPV